MMIRPIRRVLVALLVGLPLGDAVASDAVAPRVVLRHGQVLPMMPGASIDRLSGIASINQSGTIVAAVALAGEGIFEQNDRLLVRVLDESYTVLAQESLQVPGRPSLTYWEDGSSTSFYDLVVAGDDSTGWRSALSEDQLNFTFGFFAGAPIATTCTAYLNGPAPHDAGLLISNLFTPFRTVSRDASLMRWRGSDGTDTLTLWGADSGYRDVVTVGEQAPGFGPGILIESLVSRYFGLHSDGRAVFEAHLTVAGDVTEDNNKVIYQGGPGDLSIVARTGDPAPDGTISVITGFMSDGIRVNERGDIALAVGLSSDGTYIGGVGILVYPASGEPYVAARERQALPDIPNATISSFHRSRVGFGTKFDLNNAGKVAFTAILSGVPSDANHALVIAERDSLRTVFQRRDVLPDGTRISSLQHMPLLFNARDQFILPFYNLYATRPDGSVAKLSTGNGFLETDDGEVLFVLPSGGDPAWSWDPDARASGVGSPLIFNDEGQFVVSMRLQIGWGTSALLMYDIDDACAADLAEPFGQLNFFDITAFLALFNAGDPAADFADPPGSLNFFDVTGYLAEYNAGCP